MKTSGAFPIGKKNILWFFTIFQLLREKINFLNVNENRWYFSQWQHQTGVWKGEVTLSPGSKTISRLKKMDFDHVESFETSCWNKDNLNVGKSGFWSWGKFWNFLLNQRQFQGWKNWILIMWKVLKLPAGSKMNMWNTGNPCAWSFKTWAGWTIPWR